VENRPESEPTLVAYEAKDEVFLQDCEANGLEEWCFYVCKAGNNTLVQKFDSAASRCMSGVSGRLSSESNQHLSSVYISGFDGSTSQPSTVGVNSDGKREYFVPNMPENLVLLCAHAYASEGAAILHKDGGVVLRLDSQQLDDLLQFLKQYPTLKKLKVRNRTYEIDDVIGETVDNSEIAHSVITVDPSNYDELEVAFDGTASRFFNTKVNVSNSTERVLTMLLTGLSFRDLYENVKNKSLDGIPPDLTIQSLNNFEHKYGRTPDLIRMAMPYKMGNVQGLMSGGETLTHCGQRVEIDGMEFDFNDERKVGLEGRAKKLESHGKAIGASVCVDAYSGFVHGKLLKTFANSSIVVEEFIDRYRLQGINIELIAADSGVIERSVFQVLTTKTEQMLLKRGIKSERTEPFNHSRGSARVERAIRQIKELMRMAFTFIFRNPNLSVLGFTKLQIMKLWGEIFYWSIHVLNLKPCPNEPTKTRYEVFMKVKPNMQDIRLLPIFSVILVQRDSPEKHSNTNLGHFSIALYVGPSYNTPGAIRAAVVTNNTLQILTTSRFKAATDGGGLNIYPHVERGLQDLLSSSDSHATAITQQPSQLSSSTVSHDPLIEQPKRKRGRPRKQITHSDPVSSDQHPILSDSSPLESNLEVPQSFGKVSELSSNSGNHIPFSSIDRDPGPRRSQRVRDLQEREREYAQFAISEEESTDEALFADWTTHLKQKMYISYFEAAFICFSTENLCEEAFCSLVFEDGFSAVTENVPKSFQEALSHPIWGEPARREFKLLLDTKAIVEVDAAIAKDAIRNHNADLVILFPVYEKKIRDGEVVYKVRLVGDGRTHHHAGLTYSATPSREEFLIFLHLIATYDWEYCHLDESRAFLTSEYKGQNRVFTKFRGDSDRFWEVIGALYGLKTSPKDYQDHVARRLIALGFTRLTLCSCIYSLRKGDKVVLIYVFVDDFIFASNDYDVLLSCVNQFRQVAQTTEPNFNADVILGCEVVRNRTSRMICVSVQSKIEEVCSKFLPQSHREVKSPMPVAGYIIKDEDYLKLPTEDQSFLSKSDIKKYMTVVGALVYLSSYRLEVVFAVMYLSWHTQAPRQHHLKMAEYVLSYLYHSKELSLNIGSRHPVQIIAYSDASLGTAPRGRSVGSTCIQLALDSGCILAKARTTTATILSSFEAELDSITTTIKYVFRINNILQELQVVMHNKPIIYTDNNATIDFAYNKNIPKNVRHIELRMWYIRDHLLAGKFDLLFMRSEKLISDKLTKVCDKASFLIFVKAIMNNNNILINNIDALYALYVSFSNLLPNMEENSYDDRGLSALTMTTDLKERGV
jgi:hypothetical protein